ncbi:MAG: flagellar biosynthetic protein FliQ [Rhodothermaceae bacterium]
MNVDVVIALLSDVFYTVLIILLPILGVSLVFGILLSVFQAATSLQEMTLTFVPKIILTGVAIILMMPFMADKMIAFTHQIFDMMLAVLK